MKLREDSAVVLAILIRYVLPGSTLRGSDFERLWVTFRTADGFAIKMCSGITSILSSSINEYSLQGIIRLVIADLNMHKTGLPIFNLVILDTHVHLVSTLLKIVTIKLTESPNLFGCFLILYQSIT